MITSPILAYYAFEAALSRCSLVRTPEQFLAVATELSGISQDFVLSCETTRSPASEIATIVIPNMRSLLDAAENELLRMALTIPVEEESAIRDIQKIRKNLSERREELLQTISSTTNMKSPPVHKWVNPSTW